MITFDQLVQWNQRYGNSPQQVCRTQFLCEPEDIRPRVILAPMWLPDSLFEQANIVSRRQSEDFSVQVWDVNLDGLSATYIKTGIGAPVCADTVLTLGCTACEEIIFIGSAGSLREDIHIGDVAIPTESVCGDGFCRYLLQPTLKESDPFGMAFRPDENMQAKALAVASTLCKEHGVPLHTVRNYSSDTIFAQFAHIEEMLQMGCETIEMETAAVFHAAKLCGISACALFSISDNTVLQQSLYGDRDEQTLQNRQQLRRELFPAIMKQVFQTRS